MNYEIVRNAVYGLAVGDALGVPVEFLYRNQVRKINIKKMEGSDTGFSAKYTSYWADKVPKGSYSDDTAMVLATMDAYSNEKLKYSDIMENYIKWIEVGKYSSMDYPFGVGNCCLRAINNYRKNKDVNKCGCTGFKENGNGALMRILPTCIFLLLCDVDDSKKIKILNKTTALTHAHPISLMADVIYFLFFRELVYGKSKEEAFDYIINYDYSKYFGNETIDVYKHILNKDSLKIKDIEEKANGYVVDTLEGVLFSIMKNKNYKNTVLCSINLGYDTDTIAAIAGSLAAVLYGFKDIPKSWIEDLRCKDYIDEMIDKYCKRLHITSKED